METEITEEIKRLTEENQTLKEELIKIKETICMCANCFKVRDDQENWLNPAEFLYKRGILTSHGICPNCAKKLYPDLNL